MPENIRIVDFGPLGGVAEVTITVDPSDVSVLFFARSVDPAEFVAITEIIGPDGEPLYVYNDFETGEITSEMFVEPLEQAGEIALFLPVAPQFDIEPGDYIVTVETEGQPISQAAAIIRSGDVDGPQALDFNIWVVSTDQELLSSDFRLALANQLRESMDKTLNQHSLRTGRLNFFDATMSQKSMYARTDVDAIGEICLTMSQMVGSSRALNLALIDELLTSPEDGGDEAEPLAGSAAGLPGTVLVDGSPISCAVVTREESGEIEADAATFMHEGSHLMGLPHTTEQDGQLFDLFADTAECPLEEFDENDDGLVDQFECGALDGPNSMFWTDDGLTKDFVMTEDQAWYLRRHPLFYTVDGF